MRSIFKAFCKNTAGSILVTTSLSLVAITGTAGLAVIYLQGVQQKTVLQAALDSGVLAGTALGYTATDKARITAAEAAFYANAGQGSKFGQKNTAEFIAEGSPKPTFIVEETSVAGNAYTKVENTLGAALGITGIDVAVAAKARKRNSAPLCLLTLGQSMPKSLYVYGNAKLDADCPIQANSTDTSAIEVSGSNSSLSASMIGVTGGSTGTTIKPKPITGTIPVEDPYALVPVPEAGTCLMNNATIKSSQSLTPGTYCGGLTVKSGAVLILQPGIYVIKDGPFRIDSGGRAEGKEALIALIGSDSAIYMGSDSSATLTSPINGIYKNMQFMSDRDLSSSKAEAEWSTIQSGATLEYDGVLYLPEQNLWVSGTAHQAVVKAYSPALAVIVNTVYVQGNASIEVRQEDRRKIGEVAGSTGFGYSAILVR
jgi:hypothetical protein